MLKHHLREWQRIPTELLLWFTGLLFASALWLLASIGQLNLVCAIVIATVLLLVSLRDKPTAIVLAFIYLILMGDIRRVVFSVIGQPAQDPLLLVGPLFALVLALPVILHLRLRDKLSKAMFSLLFIMVLEIFNPKQGSLTIGLSGAVFYIAPVLWFWAGQRFGSPQTVGNLLHRVIFPLALFAALLGFVQMFVGFLPYEQTWIDVAAKTYTALHVGSSIRPFGFSVSATEYVVLMTLGTVGVSAAYCGVRTKWAMILPILLAGVVLASARGAIVKIIITLALVWSLRKSQKLGSKEILRLVVFVAAGFFATSFLASHFATPSLSTSGGKSTVSNALTHQAGGLAHPFDQRYSTAGLHGDMFWSGIMQGVSYPIGHGLGSTTAAASKFGGDPNEGSSEIDLSDMFISLGLIGGLVYLFVVGMAMQQALRYLREVKTSVSFPVLAILTCTLGSWLIGGQYSISSLVFFLIGTLTYTGSARSSGTELETSGAIRKQPIQQVFFGT